MNFSNILPPPGDDIMEFINLDDYNDDDNNTMITETKKKLSSNNRGCKRKYRRLTFEEDSMDESILPYGAIDKASAELDEMSVDGIGKRAIEWIEVLEGMRRKSKRGKA